MTKHVENPPPQLKNDEGPGDERYADHSGKPSASEDSMSKQLVHPDKSQVPGEPLGRDSKGG